MINSTVGNNGLKLAHLKEGNFNVVSWFHLESICAHTHTHYAGPYRTLRLPRPD